MNRLLTAALIIFYTAFFGALQICTFAQSDSSESHKPTGTELQKIQDVIKRADALVLEGEEYLRKKEFTKARGKFDQAIDAVLESGLDVRAFPSLRKYYLELVERIYGLETSMQNSSTATHNPQAGFTEQKFEPSPLDDLSKLDLSSSTPDEPTKSDLPASRPKPKARVADSSLIGNQPQQLADGRVPIVIRYLQGNLNDPYSMKLLKWSRIQKVYRYGAPYWYVQLRLRAKNGFGAYILKEVGFYIQRNKIIATENL